MCGDSSAYQSYGSFSKTWQIAYLVSEKHEFIAIPIPELCGVPEVKYKKERRYAVQCFIYIPKNE
jgi:hypothetical protein